MADTDNRGESKVKQQRLDEHKGLLGSVNIFLANIHRNRTGREAAQAHAAQPNPRGLCKALPCRLAPDVLSADLPCVPVGQGHSCASSEALSSYMPQAGAMGPVKILELGLMAMATRSKGA